MERKRKIQTISATVLLFVMLGTLIAYFIVPLIADAKTRASLGLDESAYVTDTARSPWVYVDDRNVITVYPEKLRGDTLVIPDAVNGYAAKVFSPPTSPAVSVKAVVFPQTISFFPYRQGLLDGWKSLEKVVFSEGAAELPAIVFDNVQSLHSVYFPQSLTRAPSLTLTDALAQQVTVYYAGTEEEWLALGEGAKALCKACTVVFEVSYGEIVK